MPFGGLKGSGYGRFGGKAGIDSFTELRWITIETGPGPLSDLICTVTHARYDRSSGFSLKLYALFIKHGIKGERLNGSAFNVTSAIGRRSDCLAQSGSILGTEDRLVVAAGIAAALCLERP